MDADWSVELGSDDAALEFPWSAPETGLAYIDLKSHPERVSEIAEARRSPELVEALVALNAAGSPWLTVKCDLWVEHELREAEAIYGGTLKCGSYIDLIAGTAERRFRFEDHEQAVRRLTQGLAKLPEEVEPRAAAEFIVRRCWYRAEGEAETRPGFYITFYLFGYGSSTAEASANWREALQAATPVLTHCALPR